MVFFLKFYAPAKEKSVFLYFKTQDLKAIFGCEGGVSYASHFILYVFFNMTSQEDIKLELINYKPTEEEKLVIRSAMFNFVTLGKIKDPTE